MSESEQAGPVVFRVVDKAGARHVIRAERMFYDGAVASFSNGGEVVANFTNPIGAMRVEGSFSVSPVDLVPGEACLAPFPAAPRGLVGLTWLVGLTLTAMVCLKAYELFWFAG